MRSRKAARRWWWESCELSTLSDEYATTTAVWWWVISGRAGVLRSHTGLCLAGVQSQLAFHIDQRRRDKNQNESASLRCVTGGWGGTKIETLNEKSCSMDDGRTSD